MFDKYGLSYKIVSDDSVIKFKNSSIYNEIIDFITNLNKSVVGIEMRPLEHFKVANGNKKENGDFLLLSRNTYNVFQLIKSMNKCIDCCPPIKQSSRFGNKGFQNFCDEFYKEIDNSLPKILDESNICNISDHTFQLAYYLKNSVGNKNRIDYGTGHEYLEGVRRIQILYTVEPAGSRGAWGLDDFQFLVFLFGAAQLSYNRNIKTDDIEKKELVDLLAPKYLYFDALKYISTLKHAPFHESSQMLYDISGVETWEKICSGLLKMYQAEIIQKRQILQHILFGKLIDF